MAEALVKKGHKSRFLVTSKIVHSIEIKITSMDENNVSWDMAQWERQVDMLSQLYRDINSLKLASHRHSDVSCCYTINFLVGEV